MDDGVSVEQPSSEQPHSEFNTSHSRAEPASSTSTTTTSSKRKRKKRQSKPHILSQHTLRSPPWSYVHLQHLTSGTTTNQAPGSKQAADLDAITAHQHLIAALRQFLGLHGAAIAFDITKLSGQEVWIRLAAEDRSALVAATGGWVSSGGEGWRVVGWSSWDAGASRVGRASGQDLFNE
jgi:ribonuclease P/MRP protein subunit POP8